MAGEAMGLEHVIALLRIVPLWAWFAAAGVFSCFISYGAGHHIGAQVATAQAEARGAQATINAMKERGLINEAVRNMDDCALARELNADLVCE